MTKLKICGLGNTAQALAAAEAGADFLGFVLVPGLRRTLSEERTREIVQEYRRKRGTDTPRLVGLFADQPLPEVHRMLRRCGLDMAQLCGDEPPEYWAAVDAPIIRQIRVPDDGPRGERVSGLLRRLEEVASMGYLPLLDRLEKGSLGGTGRSFDWAVAAEVARSHDFLMAGGLTAENVGQAIGTANPWGVDVSSGVETDGVKDLSKIADFALAVERAS